MFIVLVSYGSECEVLGHHSFSGECASVVECYAVSLGLWGSSSFLPSG